MKFIPTFFIIDSYSRVTLQLYPTTDETSTYINAVKVDGFCSPSKFIVTQYPLNNTVGDFWRLVDEYEISVMICLNKLNLQDKVLVDYYICSIKYNICNNFRLAANSILHSNRRCNLHHTWKSNVRIFKRKHITKSTLLQCTIPT